MFNKKTKWHTKIIMEKEKKIIYFRSQKITNPGFNFNNSILMTHMLNISNFLNDNIQYQH